MYMHEKLGTVRAIGYAIAIIAMIVVALWRLMPHHH